MIVYNINANIGWMRNSLSWLYGEGGDGLTSGIHNDYRRCFGQSGRDDDMLVLCPYKQSAWLVNIVILFLTIHVRQLHREHNAAAGICAAGLLEVWTEG